MYIIDISASSRCAYDDCEAERSVGDEGRGEEGGQTEENTEQAHGHLDHLHTHTHTVMTMEDKSIF